MRLFLLPVLFILTAITLAAADRSPLGESLKDIDIADHWIYDDFPAAVAQAKATGKPLLVVLRCVPCPPGRSLDEQVMRPDAALEKIEKQFVCVRLIQTNNIDLNLFQYDYDMSWSAMFLNSDLTVYGRYGSRNAGGKDNSDGLLSITAFRKAAERALALHAAYPANKSQLAAKTGPPSEYRSSTQIPGLTDRPAVAAERRNCVHCHMVKEYALRAKWEQGRLSTADLWVYPLPQNIGLTLDLDDGLTVATVEHASPAAAAGIARGDQLVALGGQPLISLADVQWALNAAPTEGQLTATFIRGGKKIDGTIKLGDNWKKSDIAWRASSWYALRKGIKFESLLASDKKALGVEEGRLAMQVKNIFGQGEHPAKTAGLRQNDVIIAVDGKTDDMSESDFLVNLRIHHSPKDSVKFLVVRDRERRELTIPMW
jgi:serine protease Do